VYTVVVIRAEWHTGREHLIKPGIGLYVWMYHNWVMKANAGDIRHNYVISVTWQSYKVLSNIFSFLFLWLNKLLPLLPTVYVSGKQLELPVVSDVPPLFVARRRVILRDCVLPGEARPFRCHPFGPPGVGSGRPSNNVVFITHYAATYFEQNAFFCC